MTITDEMKKAIELIATTNECVYITGKAGTGKTTFLKKLPSFCEKRIVVTASTGIAAINAGGVTLHSLLNIPFGVHDPNATIQHGIIPTKYELINSIDVLVIDEISMVRPDTIDYADQKLRLYRNSEEPFGGVQIVMFGDLYQLPPVVTANERDVLLQFYSGPYFFHSKALRKCGFHIIELNQIFRQTDSRFIEILNNIRSYRLTQDDIDDLSELRNRMESNNYDNKRIHICSYRKDVQRINEELLGTPTHTYDAVLDKDFNPSSAPCDMKLSLRVGARVMMLINDPFQIYCNGSLGVVVSLNNKTVTVKLDNGCTVAVERHEWSVKEYKVQDGKITSETKGTCTQFPLTLAWAITIHKSQGLTFDSVVIHAKEVFCPGQIYVALSRCTSLQGIVSDVFIDKKHILPDNELLVFEKSYKNAGYYFNQETYKLIKHESTEN